MKKRDNHSTTQGIDEPIIDPAYDVLNRDHLAKRIFTLIDSTSLDSRLRVGILGKWGSGKTTVMNFIKKYCLDEGHAVVSFYPWQFHSKEEAWKGFVAAVHDGLSRWRVRNFVSSWLGKLIKKCFSGALWFVQKCCRVLQHSPVTEVSLVSRALDEIIIAPIKGTLEEKKEKTAKRLKKLLKNKRLYIFVDDLDRAEPTIIYELLMLLNELINISQCVYVIGLDADTVAGMIEKKLGYGNAKEFLDKIINWPFELPEPSQYEWNDLLDKELSEISGVFKETLSSIKDVLPRNPRKFKHYIRYLGSLHKGFLHRFGEDELNWKMLYIAQLMRMEYPDICATLFHNSEIIDDIASGLLWDKQKRVSDIAYATPKKEDGPPKWQEKIEKIVPASNIKNPNRFYQLYEALRDCGGLMMAAQVRNNLLVLEIPELMTWNEYHSEKKRLASMDDSKILEEFKKSINEGKRNRDIETFREFLKMLIRDREQIWNRLIDRSAEEEIKLELVEASKLMKIFNLALDVDQMFSGSNPVFDHDVFDEWFEHLTKWAHFKEPKRLYEEPRLEERKIILKLISRNRHRVSDISEWLRIKLRDSDVYEQSKAISEIRIEIRSLLDKELAEALLIRFTRPNGMHELWPKESLISEKTLLFRKDSIFHCDDIYERLEKIAMLAKDNVEVRKNFIEFLRLILFGSNEHLGWVGPEEVREVLKVKKFMSTVWNAATARPLNRRLVGTLEERMKKLPSDLGREEIFKRPTWWSELIADRLDSASG